MVKKVEAIFNKCCDIKLRCVAVFSNGEAIYEKA